EEEIFTEAREAYLLLDKFTKGDEADKASQLFPEEVAPEVAPREDLTLAMKDTKTGETITATPDEKIHTDMMARLQERYKEMEPGWVDSKGKFYDVLSGRRTLAGFEPTPGTPDYIEWWKKLPQDQQDLEILRKRTPELDRLITGELEEMKTEQ
ncbi:unnamed protein product, partial [marine sediment metagenome]